MAKRSKSPRNVPQRTGKDLGRDDPRDAVEPKRPKHRVDHDHGGRGASARRGRLGELSARGDGGGGVADVDVGADEPQAEGAGEGRDDGRVAAAPEVDEEDVEEDGGDGCFLLVGLCCVVSDG